jgi:2-dehydro-3-deoxy-D-arabinonate dehydratase
MNLKLGQIILKKELRTIVVKDSTIFLLPKKYSSSSHILQSIPSDQALSSFLLDILNNEPTERLSEEKQLVDNKASEPKLIKPINPTEIWACGVTYKRQAKEHDDDILAKTKRTETLYDYVHRNKRVEVFFKGFDRTCVGPGENLFVRSDSKQTLPESELVLVLGHDSRVLGYTLGNDMTAWDIERECPLYLNQAKTWNASCSIGPFIIACDNIDELYDKKLTCDVTRSGKRIIESRGHTQDIKRSVDELCFYLKLHNDIPAGTLLFTGTACIIPHDFFLKDGDVVKITLDGCGEMENRIEGRRRKTKRMLYSVKSTT